LTFALVLEAFPLQMKLHTIPRIWLHMTRFGFQAAAMYHMEVSNT
jgi:hypothetical protein